MNRTRLLSVFLTTLFLLLLIAGYPAAVAQQPERSIQLSTSYPDIVVAKGDRISLKLNITNGGVVDETVALRIVSGLEGWNARIEDSAYIVRSLNIAAGESQNLYLRAEPPLEAKAGDYAVVLKATTADGQVESTLELTIGLKETGEAVAAVGVKVTSRYPTMSGPRGTKFGFKVDCRNEGGENQTFDLAAETPPWWQVLIKPEFQDKQIQQISIPTGGSNGLDIEVTPPTWVEPGEYKILIQASAGDVSDTVELTAIISGTYDLALTTATGRLDTKATAGKESHLSILVQNKGTIAIENVSFSSAKPDGWNITFNPYGVAALAAGTQREVDVIIKPPSEAIAGDYAVVLTASSEQVQGKLELRVAVATPTIWGWVGIGIVVLVIAGLAAVFVRLGRR